MKEKSDGDWRVMFEECGGGECLRRAVEKNVGGKLWRLVLNVKYNGI